MKAIYYFLIFALFCSCNNQNSDKQTTPCEFETGKIIEKVICKSDSTQSYTVYLPENYINDNSFPIVFCFDAHAGGVNAVEHFESAAEKYDYIIVASNNSKNNEPNTEYIIETFMQDVEDRISFDKSRKYTAGFSGGGRIATYIALKNSDIKGVASLSAGFSPVNYIPVNKFCFIGFFGNEDFNMYEIESSETALKSINFDYHFEIFDGEHEWAPSEKIEDALLFFDLDAMRNNLKKKDKTFLKKVKTDFDSLINTEVGNPYNQYLLYLKGEKFLKDLTDFEDYTEAIKNIMLNEDFITQKTKISKIQSLENQLQQQYYQYFAQKDTIWWKNEISVFKKSIAEEKDIDYKHLYKRLLNYLSMISFMQSNNSLSSGDLVNAEKYLKIYSLVDGDNTDMMYFYVCFYALKNKTDLALNYLDKAVKEGFADFEKLKTDPMLENLQSNQKFIEYLQSIYIIN
jgi:dienelactone hydrolase